MALTDATRLANFGSGIGTDSTLDILNVNATGIVTAATLKVGTGITMDSASGIITATKFVGPMEGTLTGNISGTSGGLSGTPDITVRNITGVAATFTGVLTYDDVTNVDSVGIITAKAGLNVVGGGATVTGVSTFFSDVSIADKIIHTGDTDTSIRFPAADTFTVETGGSERLRIKSDGKVGLGTINPGHNLEIMGSFPDFAISDSDTANDKFRILHNGGGTQLMVDPNNVGPNASYLLVAVDGTERLRVDSNGDLGLGIAAVPQDSGAKTIHIHHPTSGNPARAHLRLTTGTSGSAASNGALLGLDYNNNLFLYNQENGDLRVGTNATERLRIDSTGNFIFKNGALIENGNYDTGSGLTGDYNHDLGTHGNVHYSSSNAAAAFTYNLRINSSVSLNSVMAAGDTISFTLMHESNNTSYYMTAFKIDGTTQSVKWSGGSAPSAATGSGIDVYSFSIMKLSDASFKVFGTFTNHA